MRFKHRQHRSQMPEINLVPMMDVLMTVLTFFIIIAMTLTGQQIADVILPRIAGNEAVEAEVPQPKLVVGLNVRGELVLNDRPATADQLSQEMQRFLSQSPTGVVVLKADRELTYATVAATLKQLRNIGGDRVVLSIEQQN
jgi:biopolymer transport protein ExbD